MKTKETEHWKQRGSTFSRNNQVEDANKWWRDRYVDACLRDRGWEKHEQGE